MAYRLADPVGVVRGVGDKLMQSLGEVGIKTVLDLVLYLPYRYQDRSNVVFIDQLLVGEESTIKATVLSSSISYRGRKNITRARIKDDSGTLQCIWFNNRFAHQQLKKGQQFFFAGKLGDRKMLVQPIIEKVSDNTIHTARLVPLYSQLLDTIKIGSLRRILKEATDNLKPITDPVAEILGDKYPNFVEAIKILHFPDSDELVPIARERLALEELLGLIQHSQTTKQYWKERHTAFALKPMNYNPENFSNWLPKSIPFTLTEAQQRSTREIMAELQNDSAMNRILIGDVGSGKTVIAGIACHYVLQNNKNAVIVAPTQILTQQHRKSLQKLFPTLNIQLLTTKETKTFAVSDKPTLYIGTHAVINRLTEIEPVLIVYDEQHRFGVKQRSVASTSYGTPHILTMSATPIPRSLMLTLFSHLSVSLIDELPAGRLPTKTWLVPNSKRESSLAWIAKTIKETAGQALVVCPFIEPSNHENLSNVTAATELFKELEKYYKKYAPNLKLGLLHGKLNAKQKQQVIDQLFAKEIDLLISTPVVEVGIDLPAANIIVIEAAERFGLASLHQLRGRVGRAGQASYCLLMSNARSAIANKRLHIFENEHSGLKLAEKDLENRGAGDLFGFRQHGLSDLRFASWANLELIQQAHKAYQALKEQPWQPLITYQIDISNQLPSVN